MFPFQFSSCVSVDGYLRNNFITGNILLTFLTYFLIFLSYFVSYGNSLGPACTIRCLHLSLPRSSIFYNTYLLAPSEKLRIMMTQ